MLSEATCQAKLHAAHTYGIIQNYNTTYSLNSLQLYVACTLGVLLCIYRRYARHVALLRIYPRSALHKIRYETMIYSIQDLLFNLFSLTAIACAFTVVTTPNPIHSVLFLVGTFASAGSLLVLFGAEYLGVTFIIVYVGAIAIVFLFVIMMLNIKQAELKESLRGRVARYFPIGGVIAFLSLALLLVSLSDASTQLPMQSAA